MALQYSEQFGYVTVVCGGEVLVVAGTVVPPKAVAQPPASPKPTPIVHPDLPPPPPVGATVLAMIPRLHVAMDAAIKPAFESLIETNEFKEFVMLTREPCVVTITPSSFKTLSVESMPRAAMTEVGELPFLHNYLALK
jgi:hypothetical protein